MKLFEIIGPKSGEVVAQGFTVDDGHIVVRMVDEFPGFKKVNEIKPQSAALFWELQRLGGFRAVWMDSCASSN